MSAKAKAKALWAGDDDQHIRLNYGWLEDDRLDAIEKVIYAGLARHAGTFTNLTWPSTAALAKYANCSVRKARQALDRLVETGWISIHEASPGKKTVYRMNDPEVIHTPANDAGVVIHRTAPRAGVPLHLTTGTPAPRAAELIELTNKQITTRAICPKCEDDRLVDLSDGSTIRCPDCV